nr:immunoglobulin light chain junction region [Macaca mulatta]
CSAWESRLSTLF